MSRRTLTVSLEKTHFTDYVRRTGEMVARGFFVRSVLDISVFIFGRVPPHRRGSGTARLTSPIVYKSTGLVDAAVRRAGSLEPPFVFIQTGHKNTVKGCRTTPGCPVERRTTSFWSSRSPSTLKRWTRW